MDLRDFHNRLRVLRSIDMHELEQAGVIEKDDHAEWNRFNKDPFDWFIRAGDQRLEALWPLVEQRAERRPVTVLSVDKTDLEALRKQFSRSDFNYGYSDDPDARERGRAEVRLAKEAFTAFAARSPAHASAASAEWDRATDIITPPRGFVPKSQRLVDASLNIEADRLAESIVSLAVRHAQGASVEPVPGGPEAPIHIGHMPEQMMHYATTGNGASKPAEEKTQAANELYDRLLEDQRVRKHLAIESNPDWKAVRSAYYAAKMDYIQPSGWREEDDITASQEYHRQFERLEPFERAFEAQERERNPQLHEWLDAETEYREAASNRADLEEDDGHGLPVTDEQWREADARLAAAEARCHSFPTELVEMASVSRLEDVLAEVSADVAVRIGNLDTRLSDQDSPLFISEDSYATRNEAHEERQFLAELRWELEALEPGGHLDLSRTETDYGYDPEEAASARDCGLEYVSATRRARSEHESHLHSVSALLEQLMAHGVTIDTSFNTVEPPSQEEIDASTAEFFAEINREEAIREAAFEAGQNGRPIPEGCETEMGLLRDYEEGLDNPVMDIENEVELRSALSEAKAALRAPSAEFEEEEKKRNQEAKRLADSIVSLASHQAQGSRAEPVRGSPEAPIHIGHSASVVQQYAIGAGSEKRSERPGKMVETIIHKLSRFVTPEARLDAFERSLESAKEPSLDDRVRSVEALALAVSEGKKIDVAPVPAGANQMQTATRKNDEEMIYQPPMSPQ